MCYSFFVFKGIHVFFSVVRLNVKLSPKFFPLLYLILHKYALISYSTYIRLVSSNCNWKFCKTVTGLVKIIIIIKVYSAYFGRVFCSVI